MLCNQTTSAEIDRQGQKEKQWHGTKKNHGLSEATCRLIIIVINCRLMCMCLYRSGIIMLLNNNIL